MAEQQTLGADFIMCLDQCPPGSASASEVRDAVTRTSLWAARCKEAHVAAAAWGAMARRCSWG